MPLLDIAISQPCSCFGNNKLAFRSRIRFRNKFLIGNDRGLGLGSSTLSWQSLYITEKVGKHFNLEKGKVWRGRLMINAVSTLEITSAPHKNEGAEGYQNGMGMDLDSVRSHSSGVESQSSSEDLTEADGHEKLRRLRISKANKGKTPWNKGRKHSPETLQLIKERTRLAMQDPKVKMKLAKMGHDQTEETKLKIAIGVRLGWQKRREKLMLQETCHYEWQNLIAVAARKGLLGEDELQWDSYKILSNQLWAEWLLKVEQRRTNLRPKGNKRAPKSAEQRKKISESIAAKWADPDYRNRVCDGLAKSRGVQRVERKPRKKPSGDREPRKRSPKKKDKTNDRAKLETKSQIQQIISRSKPPSYKDPLANSKLEMLKSIRSQRVAAAKDQISVAVYRAKLMIAEAEKAAEALETAAHKNPIAQATLNESKLLIAEANQIIESMEGEETISFENVDDNSENSTESVLNIENQTDPDAQNQEIAQHRKVNGVNSIVKTGDFSINNFVLAKFVNGNASVGTDEKFWQMSSNGVLPDSKPNPNGSSVEGLDCKLENLEGPKKQVKVTKKWVHGKLVEVAEENLG